MKPVSDLYGSHTNEDIYVVGTGTSMRVFPRDFFAGKVTIGINLAWRVAPLTYCVSIGPHSHVPEFLEGEASHPEITWITRRKKAQLVLTPEQLEHAEAHFYNYETDGKPNSAPVEQPNNSGRMLDWVRQPVGIKLYQWSSMSQTAVNLAANLGAKNVILVGCDNCALLDNFHAEAQHTKWMGVEPDVRFEQYYEGLVEVRAAVRERGVNVVSLTPFLKLDAAERDFSLLCEELERPQYVPSTKDISEADHPDRLLPKLTALTRAEAGNGQALASRLAPARRLARKLRRRSSSSQNE